MACSSEQAVLGGTTFFTHDGFVYGATSSLVSEAVLYRSKDGLATVEFFAVCPYPAQYEFDYKILDTVIYAVFRTEKKLGSVYYTTSDDFGKSWTEPIALENSIQCRPRMIIHNGHAIMAYNYYNDDTKNRPKIQQGRTAVRIRVCEHSDPNKNKIVADLYSKYGIVNICLTDILGDVYMAYSTSVLALEYQNGNPMVRGKDAIRYVKLGDLTLGI